MVAVPDIALQWLALFINGFAAEPHAVAGVDAVHPDRATRGQPGVAAGVSSDDKAGLADQLWSVFARPDPVDRAAALDQLLRRYRLAPTIDGVGGLHWITPLTDPTGLLGAACVACLLDAVRTLGWARLGICDGLDCVDVYVDEAARTPRKYCSPTCSNRAKIRAYRARRAR